MSQAWKQLELRVAKALGGRRAGPIGAAVSDVVGVPFAVEGKRCTRDSLRRDWIDQARAQGKREGNPWLLVIAEHNDRRPLVVMEFSTLLKLTKGGDDDRTDRTDEHPRQLRLVEGGEPRQRTRLPPRRDSDGGA